MPKKVYFNSLQKAEYFATKTESIVENVKSGKQKNKALYFVTPKTKQIPYWARNIHNLIDGKWVLQQDSVVKDKNGNLQEIEIESIF